MALGKDEVGAYYNKGHAKEVEAKADHVNAACCLYLENDTGGSLTSGDVVFLDTDGKVSTTTSEGKVALILVVATNHDDTAQTIASAESGWFQAAQRCPAVTVDGATAIGNWLITSSTEKQAHPDTGSLPPQGTFAIAVSAVGGAGSVEAVLLPGFGWIDNDHRDAASAVHGLGSGVSLVGAKQGTRRIEVKTDTNTYTLDQETDRTITWDNAFTSILGCWAQVRKNSNEDPKNVNAMVKSFSTTQAVVRVRVAAAGDYYLDVIGVGT